VLPPNAFTTRCIAVPWWVFLSVPLLSPSGSCWSHFLVGRTCELPDDLQAMAANFLWWSDFLDVLVVGTVAGCKADCFHPILFWRGCSAVQGSGCNLRAHLKLEMSCKLPSWADQEACCQLWHRPTDCNGATREKEIKRRYSFASIFLIFIYFAPNCSSLRLWCSRIFFLYIKVEPIPWRMIIQN
jgi:hypothetical protein